VHSVGVNSVRVQNIGMAAGRLLISSGKKYGILTCQLLIYKKRANFLYYISLNRLMQIKKWRQNSSEEGPCQHLLK
jgi:hypothetical protein